MIIYCCKCHKFLMRKANVGSEKFPMCKTCQDKFFNKNKGVENV
jgi:predicted SprT family Zn-dependent metalloprotease